MKLTVGQWQHRFYVQRCISMVPAVADAVHTVDRNAADHRLDIEHYPYLSCWHPRTLGRPWVLPGWIVVLEYGPVAASAIIALPRSTAPHAIFCIQGRL